MKIFRVAFLSLVLTFAVGAANAEPCETLLCMAGKLHGQSGGSSCNGPIKDYFNIIKFKKHGKFSPSATAAARLSFLNRCPAPGIGDLPSQINAVYGTLLL